MAEPTPANASVQHKKVIKNIGCKHFYTVHCQNTRWRKIAKIHTHLCSLSIIYFFTFARKVLRCKGVLWKTHQGATKWVIFAFDKGQSDHLPHLFMEKQTFYSDKLLNHLFDKAFRSAIQNYREQASVPGRLQELQLPPQKADVFLGLNILFIVQPLLCHQLIILSTEAHFCCSVFIMTICIMTIYL